MAGKQIKVFKIVNGYRKASIVNIIETFKVTFLGTPTTIKYDINGRTYGYNEVVDLETGEYTYRAYSPNTNYIEEVGSLIVSGGDTYLAVDLKTQQRPIKFIAEDTSGNRLSGAEVTVDSRVVGRTDGSGILTVPISIGAHTIAATKTLYLFLSQSFNVPEGEGEHTKVLIFSPTAELTKGYAFISSTPQDASVTINGQYKGVTPLNLELQEGSYAVDINKAGYNPYGSSFTVTRGANTNVSAVLQQTVTSGTVTFTSNTPGVNVYLNGVYVGTTPTTATRAGGVYSYSGEKSGYHNAVGQVVINNGQNTAISLNLTKQPPAPPTYPPAGTVLETYCSGFDKYERRANGYGGSYEVLIEKNALYCGAPQNSLVEVVTNQKSRVTIYDSSNTVITVEETFYSGGWRTNKHSLKIGSTYRVKAEHIKVSGTDDFYATNEGNFTVPNQTTYSHNITLNLIPRYNRIAKYHFEFTEWSYNIAGNTNGTGGILTDPTGGSVTASIRMLQDLYGPGDPVGNSKGKMWFEIIDSSTGAVVYKSMAYEVSYNSAWITDTYHLPAGSTNIAFQEANVFRSWQKVSGSSSTDATWTGPTSFTWRAEAYQHLTWKESGTLKVDISLPFSYIKA